MTKIKLETLYTPYTLDMYSTFATDMCEEMIIEHESETHNKSLTYDDFDWSYDNAGMLKGLADNLIELLNDNIIDDVILKIELDGEPVSPREYNFITDYAFLDFTVNYDNLKKYIDDNESDYNENKIQSHSGFVWLGDNEHTMLNYYLKTKSVELLSSDDYVTAQFDDWYEIAGNHIDYKLIAKA